jgi:5-formyltetrahydrofolate cyclo-ligase
MVKNEIRKNIRLIRECQDETAWRANTKKICDSILTLPILKEENVRGKNVSLFFAHKGEPDLSSIRDALISMGANCFYPVTQSEDIIMRRHRHEIEYHEYNPGKMGIPEPVMLDNHSDVNKLMDIIFLPGIAFDRKGNRVGYGKGYYDKYLAQYFPDPYVITIAPLFSFQLVDQIPAMPHDIPADIIVTETEIIYT